MICKKTSFLAATGGCGFCFCDFFSDFQTKKSSRLLVSQFHMKNPTSTPGPPQMVPRVFHPNELLAGLFRALCRTQRLGQVKHGLHRLRRLLKMAANLGSKILEAVGFVRSDLISLTFKNKKSGNIWNLHKKLGCFVVVSQWQMKIYSFKSPILKM